MFLDSPVFKILNFYEVLAHHIKRITLNLQNASHLSFVYIFLTHSMLCLSPVIAASYSSEGNMLQNASVIISISMYFVNAM